MGRRMTLQPLDEDILRRFYGERPKRTTLGYAVIQGDYPVVIFGVYRQPERWVLFSDATAEARRPQTFGMKKMVAQGVKKMRHLLGRLSAPIHAIAETQYPGACELLEHMGFVHAEKGIYVWAQQPSGSPQQ